MRLKRETESGRKSAQAASTRAAFPAAVSPTAEGSSAQRVSGSSAVVSAARQNKLSASVVAGIVLVLVAAGGYWNYPFLNPPLPAPFPEFSITQVTDTSHAVR